MLDLFQQQWRQVGVFLHVHIQLGQLVVWHCDDFGIAAAVVGHVQDADWAGADNRAWGDRVRGHDQHVEGVTVVSQGVGDETVVGRVEHRGGHETVNEQAVAVFVDFVFDRRVVGRNFDGDVDVVRQVFASRNLAVAHWALPPLVGHMTWPDWPKSGGDYRHILTPMPCAKRRTVIRPVASSAGRRLAVESGGPGDPGDKSG